MSLLINSIVAFDIATVSFSDLKWRYGTGIDTSTGKGHYKVHRFREGVMTKLGDVELSVWCSLVEQLIERENEQWLSEAPFQWTREHSYHKRFVDKLRTEVLNLHSSRMFDDPEWVYYLPFNKQYRLEVYEQAHIVTVISECCDLPGEVTQEQIDRLSGSSVCCPHCGRFGSYTRVEKSETQHEEIHKSTSPWLSDGG